MGLLSASAQLNTDQTKLTADQAALVAAQQSVTTDTGAIATDDSAIVAALQAGPNPAFTGPFPDGSILVWTLDTTQAAGFSVVKVSPAT